MITPFYFQNWAVDSIFKYYASGKTGNPLVCMPTGCHAKGTEILMYDGYLKNVEDVVVGDLLMGPDSKPRTVLSLAKGRETMYEIIPKSGNSFIVNKNHVLSLKCTQEKGISRQVPGRLIKGAIEDITVEEYLAKSDWYKHTRKLWRTSVEFSPKDDPVIRAYDLGCLLGDGSFVNSPNITTMDEEIAKVAYNLAWQFGLTIRKETKLNSKAASYYMTGLKNVENRLKTELKNLNIDGLSSEYKYIPNIYKTGCREDRLNILAGLIDTDGSLSNSTVYDFISKSKELAEDVQFISRSLGLQANVSECIKTCQTGSVGTYYRVCISGNISIIPVRLARKKAPSRLQKKDCCVTGFEIIELEEDEYFGFHLSDDHLYLTSDFIVHHNSGKSVVIAEFLRRYFQAFPYGRVLMLTHVWKLIVQNAEKMQMVWPTAPIGIHSAGLDARDTMMPIIFGGVQSVVKNPAAMGHRDVLLIDEAHLLSDEEDSNYQKVIKVLTTINPELKVIGFTATHYRMKKGLLTDGDSLFTDICYNITTHEWFQRLVSEGFLCPLIGKPTETKFDISNVSMVGGDFNQKQAQEAVDKSDVLYDAVKELLEYGYNRQKCMAFAAGVENAEHIVEMMNSFGASATCVHSKLKSGVVKDRLQEYADGHHWAMVGANMLTTGYDDPEIDLIADFQLCASPSKHVQKLGRGTRVLYAPGYNIHDQEQRLLSLQAGGKPNTLYLDFVGNVERNGPIDDPMIPRKPGERGGPAPIRICDFCEAYNHASARFCCNCAKEFPRLEKIESTARNDSPMKQIQEPIIESINVKGNVVYTKNPGKDKGNGIISPPTVKAIYILGYKPVSVYLCFEHTGKARKIAHDWWMRHSSTASEPPATVDEFLSRTNELRVPKSVMVHSNMKYPEIQSYEF